MLYLALLFFVIAIVAGLLGFSGLARNAEIAGKIVFFVFLVLSLWSLGAALVRRLRKRRNETPLGDDD